MLHVVAQIVETELVVGAVGDVGVVGVAALELVDIGDDHPNGQPEEAVELSHPFGIAAGEVIVDGDDVDALALDRVEIGRQRGDQRLALTGAHLGDLAAMEDDAADHLDVEMAHAEHADRSLAHRGEGLGEDLVERLARGQLSAELVGLRGQLLVGERLDLLLERVDLRDDFTK